MSFCFLTTAIVLEFGFVFIWMVENGLPSQFTLLSCYEKKNKGNFSALIAVLPNSSVTSIATYTAVLPPFRWFFQCLRLACGMNSSDCFREWLQSPSSILLLKCEATAFLSFNAAMDSESVYFIKNCSHCNHPYFELTPCWC